MVRKKTTTTTPSKKKRAKASASKLKAPAVNSKNTDTSSSEIVFPDFAASDQLIEILSSEEDVSLRASEHSIRKLTVDVVEGGGLSAAKHLFAFACSAADRILPGYVTLDNDHSAKVKELISQIDNYINDPTQKRPINFLMLAAPGSGKSHFIDCIAKKLKHHSVRPITFNMASMASSSELAQPLDEARTAKVDDHVPLIFLDEFDSNPLNYSLLLPLLWDGLLHIGQRRLKLGKVIIVLAGSHPSLPVALDNARAMKMQIDLPDELPQKIVDLFSRINGSVINIPSFSQRQSDKVAIAVNLIRKKFGSSVKTVPASFLSIVAITEFRYNVRSIAHIIDYLGISDDGAVTIERLEVTLCDVSNLSQSSLAYHIIDAHKAGQGVVDNWNKFSKSTSQLPVVELNFKFFDPSSLTHEVLKNRYVDSISRNIELVDRVLDLE